MGGGTVAGRGVFIVVGTRPEAIKLAPVIVALRARGPVTVCATGQHRALLDAALADFGIAADLDLDLMRAGQRPEDIVGDALPALAAAIRRSGAETVVVQGDTASAFAGALAGQYARVPVAHVEAGLRTNAPDPFPEEFHRRAIAQAARWHFAPTAAAVGALLREGIDPRCVHLVGNSGIDALHLARRRLSADPRQRARVDAALPPRDPARPLLLATVHRRENHGAPLAAVAGALATLARQAQIVVPVHPNPAVAGPLTARLAGVANVHLLPPLGYLPFVRLLSRARLVLTDSGGVQEEAPALGVPLLVLRISSERREGVHAGAAQLVGTDARTIVRAARRLLDDPAAHAAMARVRLPYGDGHAAMRIAEVLAGVPGDADAPGSPSAGRRAELLEAL